MKKMATRQINISLTDEEFGNLSLIKERDGLGSTSVMRVGIKHVLDKPRIQAEQMELKAANEKLYLITKKLQKRIHELENPELKHE